MQWNANKGVMESNHEQGFKKADFTSRTPKRDAQVTQKCQTTFLLPQEKRGIKLS